MSDPFRSHDKTTLLEAEYSKPTGLERVDCMVQARGYEVP